MDSKSLLNFLGKQATQSAFKKQYGGWIKESPEGVAVLVPQKSRFGLQYDINVKIFIHGTFQKTYKPSKELVNSVGNIFRRTPEKFDEALNLESIVDDSQRLNEIETMFREFLNPFVDAMLTKKGIIDFKRKFPEEIFILPAVEEELQSLISGSK